MQTCLTEPITKTSQESNLHFIHPNESSKAQTPLKFAAKTYTNAGYL
ncbi:TPA: hypothetical protein RTH11_000456 [Campylobacter jejuni]|nr:hypothetical protein [Campylobacter jejuni]